MSLDEDDDDTLPPEGALWLGLLWLLPLGFLALRAAAWIFQKGEGDLLLLPLLLLPLLPALWLAYPDALLCYERHRPAWLAGGLARGNPDSQFYDGLLKLVIFPFGLLLVGSGVRPRPLNAPPPPFPLTHPGAGLIQGLMLLLSQALLVLGFVAWQENSHTIHHDHGLMLLILLIIHCAIALLNSLCYPRALQDYEAQRSETFRALLAEGDRAAVLTDYRRRLLLWHLALWLQFQRQPGTTLLGLVLLVPFCFTPLGPLLLLLLVAMDLGRPAVSADEALPPLPPTDRRVAWVQGLIFLLPSLLLPPVLLWIKAHVNDYGRLIFVDSAPVLLGTCWLLALLSWACYPAALNDYEAQRSPAFELTLRQGEVGNQLLDYLLRLLLWFLGPVLVPLLAWERRRRRP